MSETANTYFEFYSSSAALAKFFQESERSPELEEYFRGLSKSHESSFHLRTIDNLSVVRRLRRTGLVFATPYPDFINAVVGVVANLEGFNLELPAINAAVRIYRNEAGSEKTIHLTTSPYQPPALLQAYGHLVEGNNVSLRIIRAEFPPQDPSI